MEEILRQMLEYEKRTERYIDSDGHAVRETRIHCCGKLHVHMEDLIEPLLEANPQERGYLRQLSIDIQLYEPVMELVITDREQRVNCG